MKEYETKYVRIIRKPTSSQKTNFVHETNSRFKPTNYQQNHNEELVFLTFWIMKDVLLAGLHQPESLTIGQLSTVLFTKYSNQNF